MFLMTSVDDLWDHIAYVIAYAPDRFPYRDFIAADQQMNLEKALDQLRQGATIAYPEEQSHAKRALLNAILDESYAAYLSGNEVKAGHFLNDFQDQIFKS